MYRIEANYRCCLAHIACMPMGIIIGVSDFEHFVSGKTTCATLPLNSAPKKKFKKLNTAQYITWS